MSNARFTFAAAAVFWFLAAMPFAVTAQNQQGGNQQVRGGDPAQRVNRMIDIYKRELNINADQEKKIRAILEEAYKAQRPAAGGTTGGNAQTSRRDRLVNERNAQTAQANFQKMREEMDAKIKKVLTADQAKKYDALPRGGGMGGGRGMGGGTEQRIEMLSNQLGLTDAQKNKLRPILEKNQESMRQMFQNQSGNQDPQARMEAFQKARAAEQKEIEAILTPDQVKKYRAAQEEAVQRMRERMQNNRNNQQ